MIYANFEDGISNVTTISLYQWDTYQSLVITGIDFGSVTPVVHFANKRSKEALVVSGSLQSDRSFKVSIPNSLLTEKYDIVAYIYQNTGFTGQTISTIVIPIVERLKPTEYTQPSDEDIAKIEELELEAKAIISNLYAKEYSETEAYKRPAIVYYNGNAYMCNSAVEITGVLPTNTASWGLMCKGSYLVGMSKDDNGNLVFTYQDGSTFTVEIAVTTANTEDSNNIPSLLLTKEDVDKVKGLNAKLTELTEENITNCKKIKPLTSVGDKKGLYSITVKSVSDNKVYNVVMSIDSLTHEVYYSPIIVGSSYVKYASDYTDDKGNPAGFSFVASDNSITILSAYLIMEY